MNGAIATYFLLLFLLASSSKRDVLCARYWAVHTRESLFLFVLFLTHTNFYLSGVLHLMIAVDRSVKHGFATLIQYLNVSGKVRIKGTATRESERMEKLILACCSCF